MLEHAREEAEPKMRRLEGEGRKPEESRSGTTLLVVPALKSHVAFSSHNLVSTLVTFLCTHLLPCSPPGIVLVFRDRAYMCSVVLLEVAVVC